MMETWLGYDLSDLLMFSPQVYYRQIELANQDVWPGQLVAVAGGLLLALCISFPTALRNRVAAVVLAIAWFCAGWVFIASRFAHIHIAGSYAEALFYIQAAALAGCAAAPNGLNPGNQSKILRRTITMLIVVVTVMYPLVAAMSGRAFASAEVFGVAPDPTALATLIIISSAVRGWRLLLAVLPALWLVFSATMLWAMGSVEVWNVLSGLLLAAVMLAQRLLTKTGGFTREPD